MKDLETLAHWMDTKFKGPFGFRFGLDGLIGLIPGLGDLFTNAVAAYIAFRAVSMNYPASVIIRMLINIGIEAVIGVIPLLGNLFDFVWKANVKNLKLMQGYQQSPQQVRHRSVGFNLLIIATLVMFLILMLALPIVGLIWLVQTL